MLLGALLIIVCAPGASASTYTVGQGQPFGVIQDAVNAASPGDVIVVYSGTYHENVVINTAGLTLVGLDIGAGLPVVDGDNGGFAFKVKADNTTVQRFSVTNASAGITVLSNNNTISDNIVYNTGTGIGVTGSNNFFVGNIANGNKFSGMSLIGAGCYHNTLIGNTANDNMNTDLYLENSSHNTIVKNTINDSLAGIRLITNSQYNTIGGNRAYNDSTGIAVLGPNNNSLVANVLTHCGQGILLMHSNDTNIMGNFISDNSISALELFFRRTTQYG